jgi:hypothetical protein
MTAKPEHCDSDACLDLYGCKCECEPCKTVRDNWEPTPDYGHVPGAE